MVFKTCPHTTLIRKFLSWKLFKISLYIEIFPNGSYLNIYKSWLKNSNLKRVNLYKMAFIQPYCRTSQQIFNINSFIHIVHIDISKNTIKINELNNVHCILVYNHNNTNSKRIHYFNYIVNGNFELTFSSDGYKYSCNCCFYEKWI